MFVEGTTNKKYQNIKFAIKISLYIYTFYLIVCKFYVNKAFSNFFETTSIVK